MTKPKIIIIAGPTASGKSDLSVTLARQFGGEIISADSRQVYRGMDLGSGKITKKEMLGVPHYLLDIADPQKDYSVAQYQTAGHKAIADILTRHKLPIIVGGTGFYIQSLVDNLSLPVVPPNKSLRKKLETKSPAELLKILTRLDKNRAKEIDGKNPRRIVRAIEIATFLGEVPALKKEQKYDALQIGILMDFDLLKERIAKRLTKRLKQGMVAEVKKLHEQGLSWKKLESFGLEYRYLAQFLQKKITRAEMGEKIIADSLHYAKRQMTWFKKDKRIVWVKNGKEADKLVREFLK